jgi:citrate lyase gamma subunit
MNLIDECKSILEAKKAKLTIKDFDLYVVAIELNHAVKKQIGMDAKLTVGTDALGRILVKSTQLASKGMKPKGLIKGITIFSGDSGINKEKLWISLDYKIQFEVLHATADLGEFEFNTLGDPL